MSWVDEIHQKAAILLAQAEFARKFGADGKSAATALLRKVGNLYEDEYPLAKAMDSSILIVSVEGPAVEGNSPRLSLLCSIFDTIQHETEKAVRASTEETPFSVQGLEAADLALTATAPDHLYLGIGVRARESILRTDSVDGSKSALAVGLARIAQRCCANGPPATEAEVAAEVAAQGIMSARIDGVTRVRLFSPRVVAVDLYPQENL